MMSLVDPLASAMSAHLNSMMSGAYSNTKAKRMRGQRIDVSPAQDLSRQKLRSRLPPACPGMKPQRWCLPPRGERQ